MLKKNLRNSFLLLLISFNALAETLEISQKWSQPSLRPQFVSREDWLGLPLPHDEMTRLKTLLEKRDKITLFDDSDTHMKVITPSEWRILKQRLKMEDIEKLAEKYSLMKMPFEPKCLGKAETIIRDKKDYSWVIVGESKEITQLRREIWRLFTTQGGHGPEFQWKRWHPTVTVASSAAGFDEEIAHRDRPACLIELKTL